MGSGGHRRRLMETPLLFLKKCLHVIFCTQDLDSRLESVNHLMLQNSTIYECPEIIVELESERQKIQQQIEIVRGKIQSVQNEIDERTPAPPTPAELKIREQSKKFLHTLAKEVIQRVIFSKFTGAAKSYVDVLTPIIGRNSVQMRNEVVEEFTICNIAWVLKKPNTNNINRYVLKLFCDFNESDYYYFLNDSPPPPPDDTDLYLSTTKYQTQIDASNEFAVLNCKKVAIRLLAVLNDNTHVYVMSKEKASQPPIIRGALQKFKKTTQAVTQILIFAIRCVILGFDLLLMKLFQIMAQVIL
jgi:uncharacterized coiled-coil protein SlyX